MISFLFKCAIPTLPGIFLGGAVAGAWPFKDCWSLLVLTPIFLIGSKLFSFAYGKPRSKFLNTWWKKAIVYLILFVLFFSIGLTF